MITFFCSKTAPDNQLVYITCALLSQLIRVGYDVGVCGTAHDRRGDTHAQVAAQARYIVSRMTHGPGMVTILALSQCIC